MCYSVFAVLMLISLKSLLCVLFSLGDGVLYFRNYYAYTLFPNVFWRRRVMLLVCHCVTKIASPSSCSFVTMTGRWLIIANSQVYFLRIEDIFGCQIVTAYPGLIQKMKHVHMHAWLKWRLNLLHVSRVSLIINLRIGSTYSYSSWP